MHREFGCDAHLQYRLRATGSDRGDLWAINELALYGTKSVHSRYPTWDPSLGTARADTALAGNVTKYAYRAFDGQAVGDHGVAYMSGQGPPGYVAYTFEVPTAVAMYGIAPSPLSNVSLLTGWEFQFKLEGTGDWVTLDQRRNFQDWNNNSRHSRDGEIITFALPCSSKNLEASNSPPDDNYPLLHGCFIRVPGGCQDNRWPSSWKRDEYFELDSDEPNFDEFSEFAPSSDELKEPVTVHKCITTAEHGLGGRRCTGLYLG
jgi:hypothetical protein